MTKSQASRAKGRVKGTPAEVACRCRRAGALAPADAAGTGTPAEAPSHLAASDVNGRVRIG